MGKTGATIQRVRGLKRAAVRSRKFVFFFRYGAPVDTCEAGLQRIDVLMTTEVNIIPQDELEPGH